jgi:hypothetical protein
MTAPTFEATPPPLVVGQEGWYVPAFALGRRIVSECRPAKVISVARVWALVEPQGRQRVHVVIATGAGHRRQSDPVLDGRWMTAEGYALWAAKAAADSERGELVEALRVKGITVNSSVKTDVLPRLLAALEP